MKFKYFEYEHFDSPDMPGSGKLVSDELISMLDVARKKYGKPIIPNSGYRTIEHNAKVGGKPSSSHLKGLAVDIKCTNSVDRFKLYDILREVGFKRIGVGKTFIHVDIDKDKSPEVFWVY
jgi:zinc D-Ala-D-Ala carboxypeptidase